MYNIVKMSFQPGKMSVEQETNSFMFFMLFLDFVVKSVDLMRDCLALPDLTNLQDTYSK